MILQLQSSVTVMKFFKLLKTMYCISTSSKLIIHYSIIFYEKYRSSPGLDPV